MGRHTYQINEIFDSIQGEGVLTGTPSTFVRLQGCTVGCPWCDTKYTWMKGGKRMTPQDIARQVHNYHVVITGGEPTLYNLDTLITELRQSHYIQLETSGQNSFKGIARPHWITWSPKANLGYQAPKDILDHCNEVKWVVDEELDWNTPFELWAYFCQHRYMNTPYVVLMPEGCPPRPEMVEKALSWLKGLPLKAQRFWRYGDRIQYRIGVR